MTKDQIELARRASVSASMETDEKLFISYCLGKYGDLKPAEARRLKHLLSLFKPVDDEERKS